MKLNKKEQELERQIREGKFKARPVKNLKAYREAAKSQFEEMRKEARMNIRVSEHTLNALKELAYKEGLPYQSFVGSILHKYVTGQLVTRKLLEELEKVLRKKVT